MAASNISYDLLAVQSDEGVRVRAEALGLDVVAEGVETLEQAEILVGLGCHRAQGFYFAKPGPAAELRELLANSSIS